MFSTTSNCVQTCINPLLCQSSGLPKLVGPPVSSVTFLVMLFGNVFLLELVVAAPFNGDVSARFGESDERACSRRGCCALWARYLC
jgi:hypothetical protein